MESNFAFVKRITAWIRDMNKFRFSKPLRYRKNRCTDIIDTTCRLEVTVKKDLIKKIKEIQGEVF